MPLIVSLFTALETSVLNRKTALRTVAAFVLLCHCFSWSQAPSPTAPPRTLTGVVKSGKTPVPGVTVTATNHTTGQKVIAWTRADGSFKLTLPGDGEYAVRAQMAAFATATSRVTVGPSNQNPHLDLEIVLLSRSESPQGNMQGRTGGGAGNRGFQALSVMQSEAGADQGVNGGDSVTPSGMAGMG